jgi:hypothetical protein
MISDNLSISSPSNDGLSSGGTHNVFKHKHTHQNKIPTLLIDIICEIDKSTCLYLLYLKIDIQIVLK